MCAFVSTAVTILSRPASASASASATTCATNPSSVRLHRPRHVIANTSFVHHASQQPTSARRNVRTTTPTCVLTVDRLANKSFQLEEDEDSASCTSAIYLHKDGKVSMGRTDGPSPNHVDANWVFDVTSGELILTVERFFSGDNVGEFTVKRVLRGHFDDSSKNLENLPVFTGAIYPDPTDYSKNSELGWFAMILATDDLPTSDFDISSQQ